MAYSLASPFCTPHCGWSIRLYDQMSLMKGDPMKCEGACHCGNIEYTVEITPEMIGICHCRDCQIISGSAFRMATAAVPGSFHITKGEPTYYAKTAESGSVRRMAFCGTCGTHIASTPDIGVEGSFISVRVASLKNFADLRPAGEIWCQSKVSWMPDVEGTLKFDREPG